MRATQLVTPACMPRGVLSALRMGAVHVVGSWLTRRSVRPDLVPVYHAGVSQLLTFWGAERLSRRLRMTVGVFWCARPPRRAPLPRLPPVRMRSVHAPGAAPCLALNAACSGSAGSARGADLRPGLLCRGKWGLPLPRKHTILTFVGKPVPGVHGGPNPIPCAWLP